MEPAPLRSELRGARAASALILACALFVPSASKAAAPAGAASSFIDVHTHPDPADPQRSVQAARSAMPVENAAAIILMPPPFTGESPGRFEADAFLSLAGGGVVVLGGGGSLNPMIQDSARSGDAGPQVQRAFRQRAEELLQSGAAGFGELAVEHFEGATPYQSVPPDHPLFLLLADIAAEHGVPIDLHMEAVPVDMPAPPGVKSPPNPLALHANIAAFERLLEHNRQAKIIWAHAGWDNTGHRTAALCRTLLLAHPNLYMDIKIDPLNPALNSPLVDGATGPIKPEWLALFREFPDRFVIGTDQHYPEPPAATQRWEAAVRLLNQLPADVRRKVGIENPQGLFPAPNTQSGNAAVSGAAP